MLIVWVQMVDLMLQLYIQTIQFKQEELQIFAGTIDTTGSITLTAGGPGTTAIGQFVSEITVFDLMTRLQEAIGLGLVFGVIHGLVKPVYSVPVVPNFTQLFR